MNENQPKSGSGDGAIEAIEFVSEGLDQLAHGIMILDADLNLVVWNQPMQRLLDLPPELFRRGTNLAEFYRFNAARGEFGEGDVEARVREWLEPVQRHEPRRIEHTRPDGTVLEIIGNPLPTGGYVTSCTDIT